MVSITELLERTRVVSLPLRTRFRGIEVREAAIIEGTHAWAEFSPFVEYAPPEAAAWLAAALEYGFDPELLRRAQPGTRASATASIEVNATVPAVPSAAVAAVLERFDGVGTVKIKVAERGQSARDDLARIEAVRDALPSARLRVDANGGWSVTQAEQTLRRIAAAGITLEYAEQPCASVPELAELRHRLAGSGIALAADESVRKADDPLLVARAGAADRVIVKVQPLGGIRRARRVVAEAGLPATVSSALETSVGIVMGAELAAALPEPRAAAGLGTVSLFAADIVREPRVAVAGRIALRPAVPDERLLTEHAAAPARTDWWRQRIRDCAAELGLDSRPGPSAPAV